MNTGDRVDTATEEVKEPQSQQSSPNVAHRPLSSKGGKRVMSEQTLPNAPIDTNPGYNIPPEARISEEAYTPENFEGAANSDVRPFSSKTYSRQFLVTPNTNPYNKTGDKFFSQNKTKDNRNESMPRMPTIQNQKKPSSGLIPFADVSRIRPKNIMQDKERLYEEGIHLRNTINVLRDENIRLKTKINNLEKEASKFEKMIQEHNQGTGPRDSMKPESFLTFH
jgi:hypothetical protein